MERSDNGDVGRGLKSAVESLEGKSEECKKKKVRNARYHALKRKSEEFIDRKEREGEGERTTKRKR